MKFDVIATEPFERKLKRLAKKYKSIAMDLSPIIEKLQEDPTIGTPIGKDCYKIRVAISSKGKGKSGGARIITYVRVVKKTVFLIAIFDKSEQENIPVKELQFFLSLMAENDNYSL
jgi:Cytotoxic translational repressor of toxin-antitoxin stability system